MAARLRRIGRERLVPPDGQSAEPPAPQRHPQRRHRVEHPDELDRWIRVDQLRPHVHGGVLVLAGPIKLDHLRRVAKVLGAQQATAGDDAGNAAGGVGAAGETDEIDPVARLILTHDLGIAMDDALADTAAEGALEQLEEAAAVSRHLRRRIRAHGGEDGLGTACFRGRGRAVGADAGLIPGDLRLVAPESLVELPDVGGGGLAVLLLVRTIAGAVAEDDDAAALRAHGSGRCGRARARPTRVVCP